MLSLDIASLKAAYASGALTPEAVLDVVYDRIAALHGQPVWITLLPQEAALERLSKAPRGPLYGIPFAVKDNIDVAGMPTTAACPDFAYTPERSATVVERLEAAGAILVGKTNMDQFATGLVGTRSPYGVCTSVFSAEHVSGGSSSGSAVAVGAGLVSFALGTDTAGSGRVPAAFNNVVGLKPSKGVISTRGVVPACRSLDCVSIFAGTVADSHAVLDIAEGFDAEEVFSRPSPVAVLPVANFRFGVPSDADFFGDDEARSLFQQSVEQLESLGGKAVIFDYAPFRDAAALLYAGPWVAERLAAIGDFAQTHADAIHDVVRGIVLGGSKYSAVDAFEGQYRLATLMRAAEAEWAKMDVMLLPTAGIFPRIDAVLADPLGLNSALGTYTNFVNLMDLSAIAVPSGFRGYGLPFGVTLVGRAFQDRDLGVLADRLHRMVPGACIGATTVPVATTPAIEPRTPADRVRVAVVGAHLKGEPLHGQLVERNARFIRAARTAAGYRLYALKDATPAKPGLIYDGEGRGGIEVEIYELDHAGFGSFVALIPPPLGIGTLRLADGTVVKGFLCENHAVSGALEITETGGWRNWLSQGRAP